MMSLFDKTYRSVISEARKKSVKKDDELGRIKTGPVAELKRISGRKAMISEDYDAYSKEKCLFDPGVYQYLMNEAGMIFNNAEEIKEAINLMQDLDKDFKEIDGKYSDNLKKTIGLAGAREKVADIIEELNKSLAKKPSK